MAEALARLMFVLLVLKAKVAVRPDAVGPAPWLHRRAPTGYSLGPWFGLVESMPNTLQVIGVSCRDAVPCACAEGIPCHASVIRMMAIRLPVKTSTALPVSKCGLLSLDITNPHVRESEI